MTLRRLLAAWRDALRPSRDVSGLLERERALLALERVNATVRGVR